jgi:2-keto-myo-inositol isomerase
MKCAINGATTMPYSLEEDITNAHKAGFTGVEIWWDKVEKYLESNTCDDLKSLLEENEMEAAGICPFLVSPFRDTQKCRDNFVKALKVCDVIGCKVITVCPDYRPISLTKDEAFNKHIEEFKWYVAQTEGHDIKIAIEPLGGHCLVKGPMEALELINAVGNPDNLGFLLDTFHYTRSQISSEIVKKIPIEKLYIVHVNDSQDGMIEELQDKDRLYPTEGYIDLKGYLDALKAIGYEGYCSVEVFRPSYWEEPIETINKRAYDSLQKMFRL